MLFVSNNPIQVDILPDRKIIILTQNKIMFSQLDFIQEYLAMPLITLNPKKMYYEPSIMQVMVQSQTTLEVYFCDWKTQIKLIRVLILNNQIVQGISYQKQEGWQVYGSMYQYEPTRITFHKCKNPTGTKILNKCFINKDKYVLTHDRLQKSSRGKQYKQVCWKDRMMVVKNCNYQIQMKGQNTLDKKRHIICINSTYALIICNYQVLVTIIQPVIIYNHSNLLISNIEKDQYTTIKKYQNNNYVELGTIKKKCGSLSGAFLYDNQLALLIYHEKQIHLTLLPLVQQQSQTQDNQKKNESKKKIFQSISRIMEQSHEDGSQFMQKEDKNNIKTDTIKLQKDYHPEQRPLIRDIVIHDQQIKANSLNEGTSQVLSRSGIDQIQKIDDEQGQQNKNHQMSFQIRNKKQKKQLFSSMKNKSYSSKFKRQNQIPDSMSDLSSIKIKQKENNKQQASFQNQKIEQNSEINKKNTSKSIKNKNQNKNQINNISANSNNQSFDDHAETPAFGFDNLSADNKWGFFQKQWNQVAKDQINQEQYQEQMQQSLCIDNQKSILKFMPENISKKVQVFKPDNCILTTELYNQIQKSTYSYLIEKAIQQDPDKVQQYLDLFLPNLLKQAQARFFFQKMRTFNPQFTQDKIRKLFKTQLNNKELKPKMTQALQLFKLIEVPEEVLQFPPDFIKVLKVIYKDVYIQDLLKPNQTVISYMLDSYFNIQNFSQQIITIEDEQIDISHPRNMLNVLLYLNQYLGLKIQEILKVYCTKIIEQDHLQIVKKITLKQNIFEICQVPRSILDDIIIQRFNQLLNQSVQNAEYLWSLIDFLSKQLNDQYRIRLAIITELNKSNIIFSLDMFINIKQIDNDIYKFMQKIILENSCKNLSNLKFDSIYRSLYWLQQGQKISYVTFQYIQLIKTLAEKFSDKKWFYSAFRFLDTIRSKIKLSFIAKLLYTYLNSKFINRLVNISKEQQTLLSIFPQIMTHQDTDPTTLPNDNISIPQYSRCFACSWTKFLSIFNKYLEGPLQIKVLVYCEINIANQFYLLLDENQKRKFQKFLHAIEQSLITQLDDINQNDESLNPKGATSLLFDENLQNFDQTQIATSTIGREDVLIIQDDNQNKKKTVYKSMTLIDHFYEIKANKLMRRNSDRKNNDDIENNEDLIRIKLLVSRRQIIDQLTQIYDKKQPSTFILSLQLVDHQKIKLYHTEVFKTIVNKYTQYPITRIIPFNVFITPQSTDAFQLTRDKIKSQVNITNFWVIYTMIELIFQKGYQVSQIFIEKCVTYFRSDDYNEIISAIINITNPPFTQQFKDKIIEAAQDYHLNKISATLTQYGLIRKQKLFK